MRKLERRNSKIWKKKLVKISSKKNSMAYERKISAARALKRLRKKSMHLSSPAKMAREEGCVGLPAA